MHGSSARQHENVPDTLLRNEIDDVIGKFQVKVKVRVKVTRLR